MTTFSEWSKTFQVPDKMTWTPLKVIDNSKKIELLVVEAKDIVINYNEETLPFAASKLFQVSATIHKRINTQRGKTLLSLNLYKEDLPQDFQPGDTIGILPENSDESVNLLLNHIGRLGDKNRLYDIVNNDPKKAYLPKTSTLCDIFRHHVNLFSIPLKTTLAHLAKYTDDTEEKNILEYLSSKEGAVEYKTNILEKGTTLLNILTSFIKCRPTPELLVQILPRLLPRPYSIASSAMESGSLRIALSILPSDKEGVCTGMIRRKLGETDSVNFSMFFRKSHGFRLPEKDTAPLVLIGPGTGVGPFLGFLDYLRDKNEKRKVYLFTGYRFKEEFMYKEELEEHLHNGQLTKMFVSYSMENSCSTNYVQDSLKEEWSLVGDAILDNQGYIYECGDYKKMDISITDAITSVVSKYLGINNEDAIKKVKELKAQKKYLQDTWF